MEDEMTLDDETAEKIAALTGADPKRLKGLCPRCEKPMRGKRTAVMEFAPYSGMRLNMACVVEMERETVPPEPTE